MNKSINEVVQSRTDVADGNTIGMSKGEVYIFVVVVQCQGVLCTTVIIEQKSQEEEYK
jgi:hypothetical protein